MKRMHSRKVAGLTLVELLVAVALSTIIVGIVASTSVQVQRALDVARLRQNAAAQVRGLFVDIEQDLSRVVALPQAPNPPFAPITGYPAKIRPIQIEQFGTTGTGILTDPPPTRPVDKSGDPDFLPRYDDKLRLFIAANIADSTNAIISQRGWIQYILDRKTTGGTGSAPTPDTAPDFQPQPGGGIPVARLRRVILARAPLGSSTAAVQPAFNTNPVLVENVVSFQIEWVKATGDDTTKTASAREALFNRPDADTKSGDAFVFEGTMLVNSRPPTNSGGTFTQPSGGATTEFTITAKDPGDTSADVKLLSAIPLGGEIFLKNSDFAGPAPFLVRRRLPPGKKPVKEVQLGDRVIIQRAVPSTSNEVPASAYFPPALVRVTIVLGFGKGPEAETARFSRVFPVAR